MRKLTFVDGLVVGFLVTVFIIWGFWVYQSASESAYLSCILSAEDSFTNALSSAESLGQIQLGDEWRFLTDSETAIVYSKFENGPRFDCARFGHINEGNNEKNQRYQIMGRKAGKHVETRLTNLGRVCRYQ